jgi:alkanesulfonate monooxygenase SsuD/methylene tetrahydromethanopterin reductase-like flavin-dependent oxidoreductase (luciferase family)
MAPTISVRFDMRSPGFGTPTSDLYDAFLDMAEFADRSGFTAIVVSEHHSSEDGYLPSPLIAATAVAARTSRIAISVAALLVPLYEPLKLAEDIAVLDHLSRGRVSYVVGVGYRPDEYAMFDVDFAGRGRIVEHHLEVMRDAWSGKPFERAGRSVFVRPTPYTSPHPLLFYGGGTVIAARRAARLDIPFFPQLDSDRLWEAYQAERQRLGLAAGIAVAPPPGPLNVLVSDDPEATWERVGAHLLHDSQSYAEWQLDAGLLSAALDTSTSVDDLRQGSVYAVLTPDECIDLVQRRGSLTVHPLCGGAPPDVGWETLRLIAAKVQPAFATP